MATTPTTSPQACNVCVFALKDKVLEDRETREPEGKTGRERKKKRDEAEKRTEDGHTEIQNRNWVREGQLKN